MPDQIMSQGHQGVKMTCPKWRTEKNPLAFVSPKKQFVVANNATSAQHSMMRW